MFGVSHGVFFRICLKGTEADQQLQLDLFFFDGFLPHVFPIFWGLCGLEAFVLSIFFSPILVSMQHWDFTLEGFH